MKVLMLRQCGLSNLDNLPNWKLSAIDLSENGYLWADLGSGRTFWGSW